MPNKQYLLPVSNTPGSGGGGGGTGTVTSVTFTGDGVTTSSTPSAAVTTSGTLTATTATQSGNKVIASPADGSSGPLLARVLVAADIPTGVVTWDKIGNAAGNLTLANAAFTTTFNQTSAVNWIWANTTPTVTGAATTTPLSTTTPPSNVSGNTWRYTLNANIAGPGSNGWAGAVVTISGYTGGATGNNGSNLPITASTSTTVDVTNPTGTTTNTGTPVMISSAVSSSPAIVLNSTVNTGSSGFSSVTDTWTIQNVIGSVAPNPTSQLVISHSGGGSGTASVQVPAGAAGKAGLQFGTNTAGIWATSSTLNLDYQTSGGSVGIYAGSTQEASISNTSSIITFSAVAANTPVSLKSSTTNGGNANNTSVQLAFANSLTNSGAGTVQTAVGSTPTFAPTAGSAAFVGFGLTPTINQTSTSSGNYTGILLNVVETSLKGSANKFLTLQGGTTGGTTKFEVNNSGVIDNYNGTATVRNGVPASTIASDLTAQSAAIGATTLVSAPATGVYRINWSATITTRDGATSVLGGTNGFQVIYTSPTDSVVKTTVSGNSTTSAANTTGTAVGGSIVIYAKTGTNIQYQYDYTSATPGQMVYELHITLEAL